MRKRLFYWELAGFLFTAALGTLLHFVYDWSGGSTLAAAFSAVNESTWEHMKLLFFPALVFSVVQVWALGRTYPDLLEVRAISVLAGLALIPTLFYTYTGVLGFHVMWADIAVFFLAALGMCALEFRLLGRRRIQRLGFLPRLLPGDPLAQGPLYFQIHGVRRNPGGLGCPGAVDLPLHGAV